MWSAHENCSDRKSDRSTAIRRVCEQACATQVRSMKVMMEQDTSWYRSAPAERDQLQAAQCAFRQPSKDI